MKKTAGYRLSDNWYRNPDVGMDRITTEQWREMLLKENKCPYGVNGQHNRLLSDLSRFES